MLLLVMMIVKVVNIVSSSFRSAVLMGKASSLGDEVEASSKWASTGETVGFYGSFAPQDFPGGIPGISPAPLCKGVLVMPCLCLVRGSQAYWVGSMRHILYGHDCDAVLSMLGLTGASGLG